MTLLALALSLAIAALGALGVVSPARLLGVVSRFQTPAGLYAAAALRIVLGSALVVAAPDSRAPDVLPVLGVFIVLAGLVTPLFGLARYRRLLTWWSSQEPAFVRAWAAFALLFGLALAYAVAS